MNRTSSRILAACLFTLAALPALADDWDKLGTRVVAFSGEKDTIDCTGDGPFNAIKIEVDDGNIEMYNLKVSFRNGEHFSPETRYTFNQNERSRVIDLPGDARAINKIEFWYRSKFQKGRATVTVYGRRAGGGGGVGPKDPPKDPPRDDDKGWELLGIRLADYKAEKDAIEVTGKEGRFKAIKLEVDAGNVEMFNIRVEFGDGEHFSPETRLVFNDDTRSRTIDLPGEARVIRRVEFWFKTLGGAEKGRVKLYGKQGSGGGGDGKEERWEKLGSRQVNFGSENDVIEVGAVEGVFNAIRLDVEEGNLEMYNIRIEFGNDDHFSPETRVEFKQGSMSRTIDLPGEARVIRKVTFFYRSELKKGRAQIHLFGRHAPKGADVGPGPDRPKLKDPKDRFPGWEHLGTRQVDFGADRDVIDCTGEGRFTAFQVEVEDGDLEMFDIVVTFGNGDKESPKIRLMFDDSTRTRVIDLPGNKRFVKRIAFMYKSIRATRDGKAVINLYGKR